MGNINNIETISLYEYLDSASDADKRKVLYFVSKRIKELHENNYYVTYINMKSIIVNKNSINDIGFIDINDGKNDPDFEKYKNSNIYELSMLAFSAYLPGYNMASNGLLNYSVIRDNFDNFSYIFDKDDLNYYRDVIVNNEFSYYSDYIDDLDKKSGNDRNNGKSYTYATMQGKLMSEKDAAFTSYLLLTVYVLVVILIISLIIMYIS